MTPPCKTVAPSSNDNLHRNLVSLQRPLAELVKAAPYVVPALKLALTAPFDIDAVPKTFRGDFINTSLNVDLTLSAIDNGFLTGTGVSPDRYGRWSRPGDVIRPP